MAGGGASLRNAQGDRREGARFDVDRIPGRDWSPSEEATIAARLVELLPPRGRRVESPTTTRAGLSVPLLLVWLTWVSIAIAMSIMSVPRHPTATVDSGVPLHPVQRLPQIVTALPAR